MRRLVALIICLWCQSSLSQSTELPIGSLQLSLWADRESVMKEINSRYHVVTVTGQPDTFFVSDGKPPNIRVIGGVAFVGGRLSWIQRNWGSFEGKVNSVEVSKALFSALESAANSSGASATISTKVQRVPGVEFKTVTFEFAGRRVTMTSTDGDSKHGGQQVGIEESIRLRQQ